MAYVAVPNSNLEVDDPIRSADITQMNDNIIDHEARMIALEDPGTIFSHFAEDHGYPSGLIMSGATPGNTNPDTLDAGFVANGPYADSRFTLYCGTSGTWTEQIAGSTTDQHFLRATGGSAAHAIRAAAAVYFDNRVKPITCIYRLKLSTNPSSTTALFIGFLDGAAAASARPTNGIYLEVVSATLWRFTTSRANVNTVGSVQFTPPTAGTWFEVKIVFRSSPSTAADCYVDSVLKETLTGANLPTDRQIFANISWTPGATNFDIDSFELSTAGINNAT